ncbi:hypothetical protein ACDW_00100 [Acidovorax sp. DW039]|uniref:hypothetical protein n=1 Tax=Acidovorax sp. DW039 TaxID=3095606 RepID=UPI003084FF8F|nr:hypothetical protein ACDW_00100 [Acidovorax sp. DW039]
MIYEYAIDPDLVKDWVLDRDVGLAPQFGLDHRRIVSDVAENWVGEVYGALLSHFNWDNTDPEFIDAEQFMSALMEFLRQSTSRGTRRTAQPWMDQVLRAHRDEAFHAILSREPVQECEAAITPEVTRDLRNPRWYLPTVDVTKKTAAALAQQLAPLLRLASRIILIDPYFKADSPGYREVLSALLQTALNTRAAGRALPSVTLISGVADRDREASVRPRAEQLLNEARHRCGMALERLGAAVPKGMSVTFQCAAAFADGDELHNRYLLTDVGGASLPYGTHPAGERVYDDITPLFEGQYRARWKQYSKAEGLNVIGDPVVVRGLLG